MNGSRLGQDKGGLIWTMGFVVCSWALQCQRSSNVRGPAIVAPDLICCRGRSTVTQIQLDMLDELRLLVE